MKLTSIVGVAAALIFSVSVTAKDIIHDAEHHVLEAQHEETWAKEDKALDARLEELRKKHGPHQTSSTSCGMTWR